MAEKISEYSKDVNIQQAGSNKQTDCESDTGNDRDRGPPGKKVRRKKVYEYEIRYEEGTKHEHRRYKMLQKIRSRTTFEDVRMK